MLLAARYVLPVTGPPIEDGAVLVRGDEIVAVGPRAELERDAPGEEMRDFGLAALMPGFVDVHTHLEYSAFRGLVNDLPYTEWKFHVLAKEHLLTPEDWADSAMLGAAEVLRSGITTVADISDSGAALDAVVASGLRGLVYREVQTMKKADVGAVLDEASADLARWRELSDPALVRLGVAPHAPYSCHPELFARVAEWAAADGLPVATHLAGSKDEYDFIKYGSSSLAVDFTDPTRWSDVGWLPTGVSPVRYLLQWGFFAAPQVLGVHCVQVDSEDVQVLTSYDVAVAYCPRCNAKLGMGVAPLGKFLDHGLRVGLGTDSPASNDTMDVFDEMRIGLLIQRSVGGPSFFSAESYVRMATIDGARALGLEDQVGSLEPGKKADIIAVDLSHSHQLPTQSPYSALVHTSNQENIVLTMVGGRVLYEPGSWHTVDVADVFAKVDRVRGRLRG